MKKSFEAAKEKQDQLFDELANLLGALSSPVRLKIFHFLTQAPHSVEQLAEKLDQSVANTSMHLKKLQRERLLITETQAQKRIYSLARPEMKDFWEQILGFFQIHDPGNVLSSEEIYGEDLDWDKTLDETIKMLLAKKIILLDVRPLDEVDQDEPSYQHVLSIPYDEIKKRAGEIPKSKPVLVICRGRLCVMANEVTASLRKLGYNAYRLKFSWHQLASAL